MTKCIPQPQRNNQWCAISPAPNKGTTSKEQPVVCNNSSIKGTTSKERPNAPNPLPDHLPVARIHVTGSGHSGASLWNYASCKAVSLIKEGNMQ